MLKLDPVGITGSLELVVESVFWSVLESVMELSLESVFESLVESVVWLEEESEEVQTLPEEEVTPLEDGLLGKSENFSQKSGTESAKRLRRRSR